MEIAELKALLLQQTSRPTDTEHTRERRSVGYHANQPYDSVEDVAQDLDVRHLDPRFTLRRLAETDVTDMEQQRYRKPRIRDSKKLNDGADPTWTSWLIGTTNKLEQDSF